VRADFTIQIAPDASRFNAEYFTIGAHIGTTLAQSFE
jgi:hypothetical protein